MGGLHKVQTVGFPLPRRVSQILGGDLETDPPGQGQRETVAEALRQDILTTSASKNAGARQRQYSVI